MLGLTFLIFSTVYVVLMLGINRGAAAISKQTRAKSHPHEPQKISIVVAAKNEESNLPRLLKSFSMLNYPKDCFEIIIVNDHSTDDTSSILKTQTHLTNLKVIDHYGELPGLCGKKAALHLGIQAARHDLLAFTDADCVVPPNWLREINRCADSQTDYLLAYSVITNEEDGRTLRLKNFERSIYYALAAAGLYYRLPITSSACNMVYRKQLFIGCGGFNGIGHLASGDDDLLLIKMMPRIRNSAFNSSREMQVESIEGNDLRKRYHTNIRRASKFKYHPWWIKLLSAFIFVYFAIFYTLMLSLFVVKPNTAILLGLAMKTSAEIYLCHSQLNRLGRAYLGILYPLQILVFPAQFLFFAVRGTLGKYQWKGLTSR